MKRLYIKCTYLYLSIFVQSVVRAKSVGRKKSVAGGCKVTRHNGNCHTCNATCNALTLYFLFANTSTTTNECSALIFQYSSHSNFSNR